VANPTAGSDLQITAEVSDADGFVASVDFYVNGQPLGLDETAPFSVFWKPGSKGTYLIEALATDNAGNITIYNQNVTVVQPVGQAPSVSLGITANGNVTPGSRVVVTANVYDDKPDGVAVTFFMNGSQIGEPDTTAPYSIILDPQIGVDFNSYSVMALASDGDGNSRAVVQYPLYISDVSREQPNVWILTPSVGDNLTEGSRASLRARLSGGATDNVAQVIFYANGLQIGRDTTAPYAIDWIPDQLGDVLITAAVLQNTEQYDHDVNIETATISVTPVTTANPVAVNVNPRVGELPSVSFHVLPETTNLAQGSEVMFYADVQDRDGSVTSVEFFVEGVSTGAADTVAPFGMLWKTEREGEFFVNAVATDNEGNVVNSNFIPIDISSSVVTKTPQIDLANPSTGQSGDFITLRSSVRDFVNGPEKVVFYIDGQEVGSVNTKPYNLVWEANLEGDVSVFATAYQPLDGGAVVTASSSVSVIRLAADENPVVSDFDYTFPNESEIKVNPLVSEKLSFTISATDNGVIKSVELVRNGQTVQSTTDVSSPLTLSDTPPGIGSYNYSVVVTDNAGRQTVSNLGTSIQVVTGSPPVARISSPDPEFDNLTYLPNSNVTLRAVASDSDGSVVGVQFYVDGLELGAMDTTAPYEANFSTSISGTYLMQVRAQDNSGNVSSLSEGILITVDSDAPPSIDVFAFDLPGSGTASDPYIARLNQVFTIDVQVGDDHDSLASLKLVRNATTIANPGGVPVPLAYSDVLTTPAVYTYQLEARDTGGNVKTSGLMRVKATLGTKPIVVIESPLDAVDVSVGKSILVSATPFAADEVASDPGTIARVDFFVFGQLLSSSAVWPYTASFIPSAEGQWEVSAIAYSDTGLASDKAIVTLNAFIGSVPVVTKFTNSTSGNRVLTNTPITFTVEANDENGIKRVELLLADADIEGENIVVETSSVPYTLTFSGFEPKDIGIHTFQARVVNTTGRSVLSEIVAIMVENPDPENNASDFVFQVFNDMLLRAPTAAEENAYLSTFNQNMVLSAQTADEIMLVDIMEFDSLNYSATGYALGSSPIWEEYRMVRTAVLSRYVLTGAWPTREQLIKDVRVINLAAGGQFGTLNLTGKGQAIKSLIQTLMSDFQTKYWGGNPLPTTFDVAAERDAFVRILLNRKYGVEVSQSLVSKASTFARLEGRDTFVAKLMLDTEVAGAVGLTYVYGLAAPNNNDLRRADAASLLINVLGVFDILETEIDELDTEINALAQKELYPMVESVLLDARYKNRFPSSFNQSVVYAGGWRQSDWFGWFQYKDNGSSGVSAQWNYHLDLGWTYFSLLGQTEDSFWFYDPSLGWIWTNATQFPYMYSVSRKGWLFNGLYGYVYGTDRWFYSYATEDWFSVK